MKYIYFDVSDYLKKIMVLGITYQHTTRRIYISFSDQRPTIILDVWGEDIKKTVEGFRKVVKGSMNQKNQEEFISCLANNWYKIIDLMNTIQGGNGDADPDQAQNQSQTTSTQATQSPIVPLTKAELIIAVAKDNIVKLFIDEYKDPHAAIKVSGHLEVLPLNSGRFRHWLSRIVYTDEGEVIDSNVFNNALGILKAEAIFDSGDPIKLNLRVAQGEGQDQCSSWYYDLTNKNWEFIKINPDGWEVSKDLVLFHRYNNQLAQVYPSREYPDDIFNRFVELVLNAHNVEDQDKLKEYQLLLKCHIVCSFIPGFPKAVLMVYGTQGGAKTTLMEFVKMVIDPSVVKTLSFPRDINEFIQQLAHNFMACYDNISGIKDWISDELCRAVSGSGSSKRVLYTDDDDFIRSLMRCVTINGINLAASKPDLLDRSIFCQLKRIENKDRKYLKRIQKDFEEMRPQLLGYIFDILVKVMKWVQDNGDLEVSNIPRMADWAGHCEIIARCMGYQENEFLKAYENNVQIQVEEVMETSQVATCLARFVENKIFEVKDLEGKPTWGFEGTATELKKQLEEIAPDLGIETKNDKDWPKKPNGLAKIINEIEHTLKEAGIEIGHDRKGSVRIIKIRKSPSPSSPSSQTEDLAQKDAKNHTQNDGNDGNDGNDDGLRSMVKCPTCDYETERFYMKIHQCPNAKENKNKYYKFDCYECLKNHRKRFRPENEADYKRHFEEKHPGKSPFPNQVDLQKNGWKAQGKSWETKSGD